MAVIEQEAHNPPPPWWMVVGLFVIVFVGVTLLSALLSVLIYDVLIDSNNGVATLLLEKGPHKVMRRCMMVGVILFIPSFLRLIRWGGWRDSGWVHPDGSDGWVIRCKQCGLGLVVGFLTLGVVVAQMYVVGHRVVDASAWTPSLWIDLFFYVGVACTVALLEETAVRGILYRALARLWGAWPTALATSLLFAWLHFLKADPSVFGGTDGWGRVGAVVVSMFEGPSRTIAFWPRFLSLTMMGLVLCAVVQRTGTIWWAVGLHAAWVWIKKMNGALGDSVDGQAAGLWLGVRSDATDGYGTVLLLALLAIGLTSILRAPLVKARVDRTGNQVDES